MRERQTVDKATEFVIDKEAAHMTRLAKLVQNGTPTQADVDALYKEKDRLFPQRKFDHEEVFIATGKYMTGRLRKK